MYLHQFEVIVPDGTMVHRMEMHVVVPTRHVRVRHRMIEMVEPALDPTDDGVPELATGEFYEWDDFEIDED